VRKHFYEGVLYGLVGVVRVAEVAVSDPDRAPLMLRDEIAKLLPRSLAITGQDQRFETRCKRRVPRGLRRDVLTRGACLLRASVFTGGCAAFSS
jgi:hypothetical protein